MVSPKRLRRLRRYALPWLLALSACSPSPAPAPPEHARPLPELTFEGYHGPALTLPGSLRGRVVLIHFWADWCPLCLNELDAGKALAQRYRSEGLEIVAVNLGQTPQEVAGLLERLNLNYPVLFDRESESARRYGVLSLPTSYLIDREGRLQRRLVGAMSPDQLEQLVRELL